MRMIEEIILNHYGMHMLESTKLAVGAGSDTFLIKTDKGKFILKNANINEANNPENEPAICAHLLAKGLPVSTFVKDVRGVYVFDHDGALYHMQKFVEGKNYGWNTAPSWLLDASARMLGKIHVALQDYPSLPVGIGENFFRYMTPQSAIKSYENTLERAKLEGDTAIEADVSFRLELMKRFHVPGIRLDQLTRGNTHGDYFISQLICGEEDISAVIDWTSACIHPVIWEIMRSYVYAAPECAQGIIDEAALISYVKKYLDAAPLTAYDIRMLPYVFYYQIAVCDYYHQYYHSTADNRSIYLQQAVSSTKLLKWLEPNNERLSEVLAAALYSRAL